MSGVNFIGVGCSNVVDAINNISKGLARAINYRIPISTDYWSYVILAFGKEASYVLCHSSHSILSQPTKLMLHNDRIPNSVRVG